VEIPLAGERPPATPSHSPRGQTLYHTSSCSSCCACQTISPRLTHSCLFVCTLYMAGAIRVCICMYVCVFVSCVYNVYVCMCVYVCMSICVAVVHVFSVAIVIVIIINTIMASSSLWHHHHHRHHHSPSWQRHHFGIIIIIVIIIHDHPNCTLLVVVLTLAACGRPHAFLAHGEHRFGLGGGGGALAALSQ
jgi:hypothetical protein